MMTSHAAIDQSQVDQCDDCTARTRGAIVALIAMLLLVGCATTPLVAPVGSVVQREHEGRKARADDLFLAGLREYEAGSFDDALRSFLQALDSGLLSTAQALSARKHMAFIHCVSAREAACKDEFLKAVALDSAFALSAAESGHPLWGPVFRAVKTDTDARRSGRPPPVIKLPSAGEKLLAEGNAAYDSGDYNKAIRAFQDASKESLSNDDLIIARKLSAFSFCLSNRGMLCRAEFEKILALDPSFELAAAEAGHPSWGPSFRTVKMKQKTPAKK